MKAAITRLYHRFDREVIERQIEEELRFHLELLTEQHLQQDMSLAEAKDAALKRFGNVELIKDQCVEISSSQSTFDSCFEVFSNPGFSRWEFWCAFLATDSRSTTLATF